MINDFQETVWSYYHEHGRHDLPWRTNISPYAVIVSEIMLQQTQVNRVIAKFNEFMQQFPDVKTLAEAPLADVIRMWSGLGYNRRAKFLHLAAQKIVSDWDGVVPIGHEALVSLPGIGPNTAGAIQAYAYNEPVVYIETNIRSVYMYHFFADQEKVSDKELLPLLTQSLDREHTREWYWALMDYGSWLKTRTRNVTQSTHYRKQSRFDGSQRQIRGRILKLLLSGVCNEAELRSEINDERYEHILGQLEAEGMVCRQADEISLTGARDSR